MQKTSDLKKQRNSFNRRLTTREYVYLVRLVLPSCSCDLDLDPMTFIYEANTDILKVYCTCTQK